VASAHVDASATAAAAHTPTPFFVVSGHGWGHGVGMSQYGAFGYAKHGVAYRGILAHYYPGTTLGTAPVRKVRVLLAQGKAKLTISSTADFTVTDGTGTKHDVAAGKVALDSKLRLTVDDAAKAKALPGPLLFAPGTAPLELGRPYRGQIQVAASGQKLTAIDVVGLEPYLQGVVPSEMPHTWASDALKAQAVAARSYALSHLQTGAFDLFRDTRSQVYGGIPAEAPSASEAVQATARQVLLYQGEIATTFFFSSSGGRTATGAEVFGVDVPYLVSVDDHWDERSPHHAWVPRMLTGAAVRKAYQLGSVPVDIVVELTASKRPGRVVIVTAQGGQVETNGIDARAHLGLLSPNFRLGVLRLERPLGRVAPGTVVNLTGIARGVLDPAVEELRAGSWVRVARPKPRADGTFTTTVRPIAATRYRLTGSGLAGPVVAVPVAEGGA
jgi:stage II sporulation protein D